MFIIIIILFVWGKKKEESSEFELAFTAKTEKGTRSIEFSSVLLLLLLNRRLGGAGWAINRGWGWLGASQRASERTDRPRPQNIIVTDPNSTTSIAFQPASKAWKVDGSLTIIFL